jgi:P27 family predicted phage terminase small subunit
MPTARKKQLGNPSKKKLNHTEPTPSGRPQPPDYLDDYSRQVWDRVLIAMPQEVYTDCDTELLAAYCRACSLHRQAALNPVEQAVTPDGKISGWVKIEREQAALMASIGTRLGLDPSARTAIKMPENKSGGKFGEYAVVAGGKK